MPEHDLHAAAFARLDDAQMGSLAQCAGATLKRYHDGQKLIQAGDGDFRFFVIKSGQIEIQDDSETPKIVAVLGPGQFTGEITHLTGSVKRVASAVGEGAMAVQFVHEYLKEM